MNKIILSIIIAVLLFPAPTLGESKVIWKFDQPGWYLLGWTGNECLHISDIEDPESIIESIWKYDGAWMVFSNSGMDDLIEICPKEGFWINIINPGKVWQSLEPYPDCEIGIYERSISNGLEIWLISCSKDRIINKKFDLNRDGITDAIWYYEYLIDGAIWSISKDQDADGTIDSVQYLGR